MLGLVLLQRVFLLVLCVRDVEPPDCVVLLDVADGADCHHEVDYGHELAGADEGIVGGAHVEEGGAVGGGGHEGHDGLLEVGDEGHGLGLYVGVCECVSVWV